ncbi:MAG: hypothetical protein FWD89_01655 [Firmicutes bacterium]|nr:hypothetical protein [Bacillota bacterium]MCL2770996.1 hypothetical protein [Bacillota bacterium]
MADKIKVEVYESERDYVGHQMGKSIVAKTGANKIARPAITFSLVFFIPFIPLIGMILGIVALTRSSKLGGRGVSIASIILGLALTVFHVWIVIEIITVLMDIFS